MERYIKANRKVAELLQLTEDRIAGWQFHPLVPRHSAAGGTYRVRGDAVQNWRNRDGWQNRLHGAGRQSVQQAACGYRQQIHYDRAGRGGRK